MGPQFLTNSLLIVFWPNLQNVNKLDYNVSHLKGLLWKKTDECYAFMNLCLWEVCVQKNSQLMPLPLAGSTLLYFHLLSTNNNVFTHSEWMTWVWKLKTKFKNHFSLEALNAFSIVIFGTLDFVEDLGFQAASATLWVHSHMDVLINCGGD